MRKSGSAKEMCPGPGGHQLVDVGHHRGQVGPADPAVVDDRDGTVPAPVRAAPAGFDRPDQSSSSPAAKRAYRSSGGSRWRAGRRDSALVSWITGPGSWPAAQASRAGLELAGDDGVGGRSDGEVAADRGVQPEEAQRRLGSPGSDGPGHPEGQAHGRVHGHRQGDPVGPVDAVGIEGVEGDVGAANLMARGQQGSSGRGHVQRLVSQLVGGHQEDPARWPSL